MNKVVLFLFLLCFTSPVKGQTIVLEEGQKPFVIGMQLEFLEDPSGDLDLAQVIAKGDAFQKSTVEVPNFQYTKSAYWVRFQLYNNTSSEDLALEVSNTQLDRIDFYVPHGLSYTHTQMGDLLPYSQRAINHQHFIFPFSLLKKQQATIYLRFQSMEQLSLPLSIGKREVVLTNNYRTDIFAGTYFGIMFVMFFYNLFIYISVKDKSYLFYVLYILSIALAQATLLGYTYKYFWPENSYLNHLAVLIFSAIAGYGAIQFARIFLQLDKQLPKISKGLTVFEFLYGAALLVYLLGLDQLSYNLLDIAALLLSLYALFFSIKLSIAGQRTAKFFLLAWSFFMIGMFVYVARNLGWLPYNFFTKNVLLMGSGVESVLLSVALADRINILKREKEASQAEALRTAEENAVLITQQNVLLEAKVKERTSALESTNKELEYTLTNLKSAQTQLVNAEKMASLGQLTAGIAHEINNPINFVTSNVVPLKRDMEDIFALINVYDQLQEELTHDKHHFDKVLAFKKEIDFDYLKEEIKMLLNGIGEGANRTAEIVKGLRIFSRLDESDLKKVDLNEGIDSTLVLLNSSMANRIQVVKNYDPDAYLECYPGKLNQVIMNIANNAIHAMLVDSEKKSGTLSITTKALPESINITISDTGKGMSEEVCAKIFDPFFTTKGVGQGTGLGLSIVYSIIELHKGSIKVTSEIDKGTIFSIDLPKYQR
ncbi:MAG: 7TM diverse intracellular signaling domain-containing protein [Sphingobacteriaceae bacterium]|nr:7TM diverse intracellular signaling domain-containing protein [Sphingobacteriaceae bacterium]